MVLAGAIAAVEFARVDVTGTALTLRAAGAIRVLDVPGDLLVPSREIMMWIVRRVRREGGGDGFAEGTRGWHILDNGQWRPGVRGRGDNEFANLKGHWSPSTSGGCNESRAE